MEIIGLLGYIGSGKGTVADMLVEKHGYTKINFADTLKDITSTIFGWDRALLEGDTKESRAFRDKVDAYWTKKYDKEITPRYVLQHIGTEVFRETFDADIWVNCLEKKIHDTGKEKIVIADTRFPNECEFVLNKKGFTTKLVSVWRDLPDFHYPLLETTGFGNDTKRREEYLMQEIGYVPHASETAWVIDYMNKSAKILNDGNLDDLEECVDWLNTSMHEEDKFAKYIK